VLPEPLLLFAGVASASHMPSDCAGYSTGQSYARHPLLCTGEHLGFRSLFLPEMAIKTCVLSHATVGSRAKHRVGFATPPT
jgi:hypothetical protein